MPLQGVTKLVIKGGLEINDTEGLSSVFSDFIKQIGTNVIVNFNKLLQGKMNILKIKKPIKLYSATSHLESICYDFHFTELLLKAADQSDPVERLKYVSGIHIFPYIYRSKGPLEPILGETYQARQPDGTLYYSEQVAPFSSNFLVIGPDSKYKIFGSSTVHAELKGINGLKATRKGRNFITFKDGTTLEFTVPDLVIDGLVIGNRVLNYDGSFYITDTTNNLLSNAKFSYNYVPEKQEGGFTSKLFGFFGKKEEPVPYDTITFTIRDKCDKLLADGNGSWIGQIYFNGKRYKNYLCSYWSFDDDYVNWTQDELPFILASDSMKREDLIALRTPLNYKEAQIKSDEILGVEKDDQFFRSQNKK